MPIFDLYQISRRRSSGLTARIKPRAALRHRDHGCHHRHCHHHHNRNHHSILLMTFIILGRKYKKRVTIRRIKTQQHEWCHLFHPFPGQPAPPHPPSWLVLCIIATISVIINFNIAEPFTLYLSSSYSSKSSPILSRLSDRQTQLNSAPLHPNYFWPNDNISEKKTMNPNKKGVASCTHCCSRRLRHFLQPAA